MSEWVKNTGVMPVEGSVLVDTLWDDRDVGHTTPADCLMWQKQLGITHWRLHEEEKTTKPTPDINPKAQSGSSKLPLNLWSPLASAYGALGLANGEKYGYGNYKATPVLMSIYLAATLRHLFAFMEGQECDPVEGTPHIAAILANMAIILEARSVGTIVDDRGIQGGYLQEIEKLTEIANKLKELHKDKEAYHYTIKDNKEDAIK